MKNKLHINIQNVKSMLSVYFIRIIVILFSIDLTWKLLEILFDGGIQETVSDSIIALALLYFINREVVKWIEGGE